MANNKQGLILTNTNDFNNSISGSYYIASKRALAEFLAGRTLEQVFWASEAQYFVDSIVLFPFPIPKLENGANLNIGFNTVGVPYPTDVIGYPVEYYGFYMGQYYYNKPDKFTSYEPYTELRIYLPYYGYVNIPISEVINKYIQFRLYVDFSTGQATYVIGSNYSSVDAPPNDEMYLVWETEDTNGKKITNILDDKYTRIVGTYTFQFGYPLPVGKANASEGLLNIIMSGAKIASVLGGAYLGDHTTTSKTISTTTNSPMETNIVHRGRSDITNRMRTEKTIDIDRGSSSSITRSKRTVDYGNQVKNRANQDAFSMAVDALNTNLRVSQESSGNGILNMYSSNQIQIFEVRKHLQNRGADFNHLFGLPLAQTKRLGDLYGYTEISNIHLDGNGFKLATLEEMNMIEAALSNGFIL